MFKNHQRLKNIFKNPGLKKYLKKPLKISKKNTHNLKKYLKKKTQGVGVFF